MRSLTDQVPISAVAGIVSWAQLIAVVLLAAVLLAFYRVYRRSYLLDWGLSWVALAAYLLGGTMAGIWARLLPAGHPIRLGLTTLILLGGFLQIVWLLAGLSEFAWRGSLPPRLRRRLLGGAAVLAAALALLPELLQLPARVRILFLLAPRSAIASVALLVAALLVLRMPRRAGVIGRRLMFSALLVSAIQQSHQLASLLGWAIGGGPGWNLASQMADLLVQGLLGGAMIVWLLEEERQQVVRASRVQACVYRISESVRSSPDLDALFAAIHAALAEILPARNFYIALFDEPTGQVSFPYFVDERDSTPAPKPLGRGLTEYVLRTRRPLLATPAVFDALVASGEVELIASPSVDWLGAPLLTGGRAIGVVALQTYDARVRLSVDDRDLLVYTAEQVASAIEAKRAQDRLQRSAEAYRRLFESNPVPMLVYDPFQDRFLAVNAAAIALFGYTSDEFLARGVPDLLVPEERAEFRSQVSGDEAFLLRAGVSRCLRKDGSRIDVDVTAHGLDWQGRRARVYAAVDVTEQRRSEAAREELIGQLEAKNTELERFTYTVSHDLKSPLITIRGFLGFVARAAESGDLASLRADMARIEAATGRMERLLSELLELSRIGRVANPAERIAFGDLVREAAAQAQGALSARGVEVEIERDLPTVWGDRIRILEVVQNLLENAVKFMGEQPRPRILIGARDNPLDGQATLFVSDNGVGIDAGDQDRVFRLFDKLDADSPGTGVGLAIVRRILEVHGGRIWVESAGRGSGSTFVFTLPLPPEA